MGPTGLVYPARFLVGSFSEEDIDPVEGDCAAAYHHASGNGSPENVGARKLPNRQQRRQDGDENAQAGDPEGNTADHGWIKKAAPPASWLGVRHVFVVADKPQILPG